MCIWAEIDRACLDGFVVLLVDAMDVYNVPAPWRPGLRRYIEAGILPGGFLQAVLCNDLEQAIARAEPGAAHLLPLLIDVFRTALPPCAWGSRRAVLNWTTTPGRLEMARTRAPRQPRRRVNHGRPDTG